jgi:predicted SAM-dependent methyltransferase
MYRINAGCGMSPTQGWLNFDNSLSIKLSAFPTLVHVLYKAKLINQPQMKYILFCLENKIRWANVTRKIPVLSNSTEVLYSSHMLEHLDRNEAKMFLAEARRVLGSGGIVRLAVPDIEQHVKAYISSGDADFFIESMQMSTPTVGKLSERLRILFIGVRHHQWMYDSKSLCKLLNNSGFTDAKTFTAGETRIKNSAPLDLYERMEESVYVEAIKA